MPSKGLEATQHSSLQIAGRLHSDQHTQRASRQARQRVPPLAAPLLPAMRRRALGLLQRAAAGLPTSTSSLTASGIPGTRRRLAPLAAALPHANGSSPPASNGSAGVGGAGMSSQAGGGSRPVSPPAQPGVPLPASMPSLLPEQLDAAVSAAAAPDSTPRQRAMLRDAVVAKMAALQAHLAETRQRLWALRTQPDQLAALGISSEELQTQVLIRYGTGQEALGQLAALVAAKQAAVMEGGAEHWARLQEERQGGAGDAPTSEQAPAPAPAQGWQQQVQQQAPQAGSFVPAWRAQRQADDAAAAAAAAPNQQQQQQEPAASRPPPSSDGAMSFEQRRAQWQQGWQQGQPQRQAPQAQQQQAPVRASIRDLLNERKIRLPQYSPGTYNHLMCPECLGGDKGEKSLSVTIEEGSENAVWNCFRAKCGWTGGVNTRQGINKAYRQYTNDAGFAVTAMRKRKEESPMRPNPKFDAELSPEVVDFFAARGISAATLERNRVAQETLGDGSTAIAFPYYRDGQLVNIKYRGTTEKKFWQVKGAEKVLYGLDDVVGLADIVVVEGEMDKLALEEAGVRNVVSVPDGAPARVKEGEVPPADQDTKFSYLWNCRAWLDAASKIVIATDNDAPGDALAEELARRLGRERCWRVRWPLNEEDHAYAAEMAGVSYAQHAELADPAELAGTLGGADVAAALADLPDGASLNGSAPEGEAAPQAELDATQQAQQAQQGASEALQLAVQPGYYRKDANEVLVKDGPDMLRAFLDAAEPFPIRGLLRFHEYYDDIMKHYRLEHKDGEGRSSGWPSLDALYKIIPGELTIVTGVPNSGKSEWIDALLANLAEQHDWCFALCSMEKKATDHARQLVEKYVGKPFFDLPYARGVRRMSERELDEGLDWIDDRFHLIRYEDDALPAVDWVLDVARAAVYRYGIRGLVIDPYNELDHQRPASMNETEYVSQMLTKVKRFAQTTGVHVWFVAHPRQLREWKGQAPNLYDISGSAHFINKADNGIVVHRDRDPDSPDQHKVHILVRKVRNKAAGTIGDCVLEYERINGRYIDPDNPTGGPRTAQRVDFSDVARRERLAAIRQEEREAALSAAVQAEIADAAFVSARAEPTAAPRQPAPAPAAAVADAAAAVGAAGQAAPQQARRAAAVVEPPPVLKLRLDGTVSSDPVTDEAEVEAWLEGVGPS